MGKPRKSSNLRRARHRVVYWGLRVASAVLGGLPLNVAIQVGRRLGMVGYYLAVRDRHRALDQLEMGLGNQYSEEQRRKIVRRMFGHLGSLAAEMAYIPRLNRSFLESRICLVGEENYRKAVEMSEGRGVIGITAHLGAWEWIPQYGKLVFGTNTLVIAREVSNPLIQEWTEKLRQTHGVEIAYRKQAGFPSMRMLRRGGGLGILLDQCTKGEGVFVPFFGKPAHTLIGPARLALAARSVFQPVFLVRNPESRQWSLHFFEPIRATDFLDSSGVDIAVYRLTARLTSVIEEAVRRWPDQWVWFHRRWKRQPESDGDPVFDPGSGQIHCHSRKSEE